MVDISKLSLLQLFKLRAAISGEIIRRLCPLVIPIIIVGLSVSVYLFIQARKI